MSLEKEKNIVQIAARATFVKPAAKAANAAACTIVTNVALDSLTNGVLTIAAQPDYPRTLQVILTDAATTGLTGTVTVVGVDQNGVGISEVFTISTPAASTAVLGTKAFAKVTGATWTLTGGEVTADDDKVAIGYGDALGLPAAPGAIYKRKIKSEFNGGDEAGTFDATYGTYKPTGVMDGAKAVEVTFLYALSLVI